MSIRGLLTLSLGFLVFGGAPIPGEAAEGEAAQLGRLFFTPTARAELERQKRMASIATPLLSSKEPLRVDGVVVRSSGRNTVWLNGQPLEESAPPSAIVARVSPTDPARVRLLPAGEAAIEVTVGVRFDRNASRLPNSHESEKNPLLRR